MYFFATLIFYTKASIPLFVDELQATIKANGYPNAQSFANIYNQSEKVISEYNRDFKKWENENAILTETLSKQQEIPPEIKNVHKWLRQLRLQAKDSTTKKKFFDHER